MRDGLSGILFDGVGESVAEIEQAALPALVRIPSGDARLDLCGGGYQLPERPLILPDGGVGGSCQRLSMNIPEHIHSPFIFLVLVVDYEFIILQFWFMLKFYYG